MWRKVMTSHRDETTKVESKFVDEFDLEDEETIQMRLKWPEPPRGLSDRPRNPKTDANLSRSVPAPARLRRVLPWGAVSLVAIVLAGLVLPRPRLRERARAIPSPSLAPATAVQPPLAPRPAAPPPAASSVAANKPPSGPATGKPAIDVLSLPVARPVAPPVRVAPPPRPRRVVKPSVRPAAPRPEPEQSSSAYFDENPYDDPANSAGKPPSSSHRPGR
jgi:hypothetical protein